MSGFVDNEKVFDALGFKKFLSQAEFLTDDKEMCKLDTGAVDKVWAKCKTDRKSISRGDFVNKGRSYSQISKQFSTNNYLPVVPELASLLYGNPSAENAIKVWQSLSKSLLKPNNQVTFIFNYQKNHDVINCCEFCFLQTSSTALSPQETNLPTNSAVFTNTFNE